MNDGAGAVDASHSIRATQPEMAQPEMGQLGTTPISFARKPAAEFARAFDAVMLYL